METFEFKTYINVEAENYDSAIAMFDSNIRYGLLNKDDIYVADIKQLTFYNNESVEV
jgi:hypothetical protein